MTYQNTGDTKPDDVLQWMAQHLEDNHVTWDARTGDPVPDSIEACKDVASYLAI